MTKKFGMIFALLGAMAFYGSNTAYSSPKDPTNLVDFIKAKRVAEAKNKVGSKTAHTVQAKGKSERHVSRARTPKAAKVTVRATKVGAHQRRSFHAKTRSTGSRMAAGVDRMTTGSVVSAMSSTNYSSLISSYAVSYGVPVSLAKAVVRIESNYQPNMTGSAGEIGLMQIKLETARGLGYTGSRQALYNPETNIRWGMKYLAGAHDLGNSTCGTILRYNAGHGATRMNPVSASYCAKVKMEMASM